MKYLNALNKISGLGPQKMKSLLNFFEKAENIWQAELADLKKSPVGEKMAEKIYLERKNIDPEIEWEKVRQENIKLITFNDPGYPCLLKEISHPPFILYVKGDIDFNFAPTIAIIGARKCTAYGQQAAKSFARELASSGITVVSGMALGIDSWAHRGALEIQGKTIAVLGNSLDKKNIYPRNNSGLACEIASSGALVSEYPIETLAGKLTFPARNRIVAGLSLGVLIIEAEEKSGALITSQMALEENREVFSLPGSIFSPLSVGTNNLIKKGAKAVTNIRDILEELNLEEGAVKIVKKSKNPASREEKIILHTLSPDPIHIDNIVKLTKLQTATVSSILSLMEIKGWTKNIGGQNYIIL